MAILQPVFSDENIEGRLASDGAILFRDVGVSDARSFEQFAGKYVVKWMSYQDRATKRGHVGGHVHTSTDTSPAFSIPLHCESSFTSRWPQKIFFYCHLAPTSSGRTPICDVRQVYRDIDPDVREKFERLGVMYYRNFGRGVGMDWRDVFQRGDRHSVDEYCASNAIYTEWLNEDHLRTIQVRPATLVHPVTRQTVWFNHVLALHQFSLDDSLKETLMRQRGEAYLPHNAYFGNGEPIPTEVVEHIRDVHNRHTILFEWHSGDVLMLDNMLMAHGREPYQGKRIVYAALADPLSWIEMGIDLTTPTARPRILEERIPESTENRQPLMRRGDDDLTSWFLEVTAKELKLDKVDASNSFSEIGGDSLAGVVLISEVFDRYGVDLSLEFLMESATMNSVLDEIRSQLPDQKFLS